MGRMQKRREKDVSQLKLLTAVIALATAVVNLVIKLVDMLSG